MKTKKEILYRKVTLEGGEDIFVRKDDFDNLRRKLRTKAPPREIVRASIKMLIYSPEGATKLTKGLDAVFYIAELGRKKQYLALKRMRDLVDFQLKKENMDKKLSKIKR